MTAPQCSGPSLGIDIGGTKTQAVLLDASSRVIANRVRRTDRGPDGVVGGALALARECLQLGRTQVTELMGVGVGIPGQVDHCSGVVLHAVNLGIERLELGALLSAELGVAVRVDNDVKATALGAADYLRTPTADLSYINLGTGIASATLVGGRLVRGEGNLAGEIGHLPVDPSAGRCVCGQIGCLEVLAGGRRIAERLAAAGLTLPGLVEATHAGDQAAIDESLRIGGAIATAVQLVVLAHGSARVALGGGVVRTAPAWPTWPAGSSPSVPRVRTSWRPSICRHASPCCRAITRWPPSGRLWLAAAPSATIPLSFVPVTLPHWDGVTDE